MLAYKDESNPLKLSPVETEKMRHQRKREIKGKNALREILVYSMFIWVQLIVAYSKTDPNIYNYKQRLNELFVKKSDFSLV